MHFGAFLSFFHVIIKKNKKSFAGFKKTIYLCIAFENDSSQ
jgi:hypothetical protein